MRSRYLPLPFAQALALAATANNIQVSNVTLTGQVPASDTWQVQFDVSWENSWRTSTAEANYDAAWIFMKFRANAGPWQHALLSSTGHVQPAGGTVAVPADLMGAFLFRNANGIGNVSYTGAQLRWNYGASGVPDAAVIEIRVLAIEMVYIPQGAFYVGDGSTTVIDRQFELGQTGAPFQITSEAAITLGGSGATSLNAHNNSSVTTPTSPEDYTYTTTQTLPAAYPKGFNDYYVMKYECTEGQYVDFLNMLTTTQAALNFPNNTGTLGSTIDDTGTAPDIYVTTAPERVMQGRPPNADLAYDDWAGLRPLTELEWEKACRGPIFPVPHEFAWGSTSITSSTYVVSNAGLANETVNVGAFGSVNCQTTISPIRTARAGIFAGSVPVASRVQAGAGYYGCMELSASAGEIVVCVGTAAARAYTGNHGDGTLTAAGGANVAGWPTGATAFRNPGATINVAVSLSALFQVSDRADLVGGGGAGHGIRACRRP